MDMIESVEETPDTIVTLATGKKMLVKEKAETICQQVLERRRAIFPPSDKQYLEGVTTNGSR